MIAAAPATLNPAPRTCTSRWIGIVRHVCDDGEGRAGGGGGAQIGEEEGGRGRGAGADAYSFGKGHFWQWSTCWRWWLVYHRRRGGCRPGDFGQWSTCWRRWLVYPHCLCQSGGQRLSFSIWASDADTWARHYYFWIENCFPQILYPINSNKKFVIE
jgi:hypothetical protein